MLDDIDRAIISHLQYDGRMPFTKIANALDITEGSVRRRAKMMIEKGVMQVVAIAEPEELGFYEAGMIGITVQAQRIKETADAVAQLPEVIYLVQVTGEFDLFAEVYCKNREDFVSFLNNRLQKIPGVEHTQSFLILKMHKLSYRWGEAEPPRDRSIHTIKPSK
ncbi:MAG: Lrp/AsnC family transcriptional regulator [Proteobacteria bacterium]|nr:Lrp/AsnC family transcriptional regulator [Pseudomonadota bacterium]